MSTTPENHLVRRWLLQANDELAFVPQDKDGARTVSLVRFGEYSVRLVKSAPCAAGTPVMWIELYDHDLGCGIDSCGCYTIEEALVPASDLILRAKKLHRKVAPGGSCEQ